MKSINATRWTRAAILAIGNITAQEGEDSEDQSGSATGGSGQANSDSKDSDSDTGGSGKEDDDEDEDPAVLKRKLRNKTEEQDRQFKLWQADKKRADDLQKVKDEADRKGKTDLENAQADVKALKDVISAKDKTIQRLSIENAFTQLEGIVWHNPAAALKLVDLSDVEFDNESGQVKDKSALVAAAKSLAKENPFLVKTEDEKDADKKQTSGKRTGTPPKGGKMIQTDDEVLRKKYNIRS